MQNNTLYIILVKFEMDVYINNKLNKIRIAVFSERDEAVTDHEGLLSRERGMRFPEGYHHPIS